MEFMTQQEPGSLEPQTSEPCTCCKEPRPAHWDESCLEWVHDDDETEASMFHCHVNTSATDCDGPHQHFTTYRVWSLRWSPSELVYKSVREPDAWDLWRKLASLEAPLHSPCEVKVEFIDDDEKLLRMTWHRRTDEGSEGGEMYGCTDPDCAFEGASQRDVFAERMGY